MAKKKTNETYTTNDIYKMEEIAHIRKNQGMYVGDSEDATRLLIEILDNSLDEVQSGFATIVAVYIDTVKNEFKILDNGRGIPFDKNLPPEQDPPILICNSLLTSGKFDKSKDNSVYKVSSGLHGVGMTCVRALSDEMTIEIYRDKQRANYVFKHDGSIHRDIVDFTDKQPFSTKVWVRPSPSYFDSPSVNVEKVVERLEIACANFPDLKIALMINDKKRVIDINEDDLVNGALGEEGITDWFVIKEEKKNEECLIKFKWAEKGSLKTYSTVNLCCVKDGAHINKVVSSLKEYFSSYIGKVGKDMKIPYSFEPNDCLVGLKLYINLKVITVSFSEQIKDRLGNRTDLSIMDNIDKSIEKCLESDQDLLHALLKQFHDYRYNIIQKKLDDTGSKVKRGFSKLTKLYDCDRSDGELIIGEGKSAVGGLVKARDPNRHAILPLRGVPANVINKTDFYKNEEMKDIITACGCGIFNNCDVDKLRYKRIILAADADPAGHWITSLLITMFAYTMAPVVKAGKLFICETPLYGTRISKKFVPLWTKDDVEKAKEKGLPITRFKGLGEFNPQDLKIFTLDEKTRRLYPVEWSEKHHEQLFDLMSKTTEKKKLVLGEWRLEE